MGLGVFNFELVPSPLYGFNEYYTVKLENTEAWLSRQNGLKISYGNPQVSPPQPQSPRRNFLFPRDRHNASGKLPLTSA